MWLQRRTLTGHKKSRFQANTEILAVFYSEKYGDFVKLINTFGVIGTLSSDFKKTPVYFNWSFLIYWSTITNFKILRELGRGENDVKDSLV